MEQWRDARDGAGRCQEPPAPDDQVAATGAIGSFGATVPAHLAPVLHVVAALMGLADAEDAVQEAVLRAWQSWETLRDVAVGRSWLLRITGSVCRDWQRGRFGTRRSLTLPLLDSEGVLTVALLVTDPGTSDHTGPLDLRQAMNELDLCLRAVVALPYYAELDATEIGGILNPPPATVRTRLRRALALLREGLGEVEAHTNQRQNGGS